MIFFSACSKDKEMDIVNEDIKEVIVTYYSDSDRQLSNWLELHLIDGDTYIKYRNYYDETENQYKFDDIDAVKDFVKNKVCASVKKGENGKSNNSDKQQALWVITVITENDIYNYSDYDEYPDYWDELWELIISVSGAKDISEFRVEE